MNKKIKNKISLSRTKIDEFLRCPRCFYLKEKYNVSKPSSLTFPLNNAVDDLIKKELDYFRKSKKEHNLLILIREKFNLKINLFEDLELLRKWRNSGIKYFDPDLQVEVSGKLDDVWVNEDGELVVVDFKATSTTKEINLEDDYKESYKREVEIYQWLLKMNGFNVSNISFFVYFNALKTRETFDNKLEFENYLFIHEGNIDWVQPTIYQIKNILEKDELPQPSEKCEYCKFYFARREVDV